MSDLQSRHARLNDMIRRQIGKAAEDIQHYTRLLQLAQRLHADLLKLLEEKSDE
jgi:hypothetical protein